MFEQLAQFVFSALLGLVLLVVVVLLARKSMIKEMKKSERPDDKSGEATIRGESGGPNQG